MSQYILGIGGFVHDASAALLKDGVLIGAVQEERLTRKKHVGGFPIKAIGYCLKEAGIGREKIDKVVFYTTKKHFERMLIDSSKEYVRGANRVKNAISFLAGTSQRVKRCFEFQHFLRKAYRLFPKEKFVFVDHHDAHAAGSYMISPFKESIVLCVDAVGDGHCSTVYHGKNNKLEMLVDVKYPHSISHMYTLMTHYLGFLGRGNQYKVMGLSAYGVPEFYDKLKEFVILKKNGYELNREYFEMRSDLAFRKKFYDMFGPKRMPKDKVTEHHANLAKSMQKLFEEVVFHLCYLGKKLVSCENVCISGGSALNCVANGRIIKEKVFKNTFIPPCAGDGGTAVGSAFYYYNVTNGTDRNFILKHDYWGTEIKNDDIRAELEMLGENYTYSDNPLKEAARYLSENKIVGLFRGRMEYGPRALGNRSILANPSDSNNRERINRSIKFREEFRPFAPAILSHAVEDYFESPKCLSPFMTHAFLVKQKMQKKIPAVVHVDGTGRLQTVKKEENPDFYTLIEHFGKLTGIPVVLNTSFNLAGDPIVCYVTDAVRTFHAGEIDVLIIENYILEKENN